MIKDGKLDAYHEQQDMTEIAFLKQRTGIDVAKLEKENKELKKQISILLSCKDCPDNKGGYICEKEYNDKCLTQKIQYIKELQEEIAEAKEIIKEALDKINCVEHSSWWDKAEKFLAEE